MSALARTADAGRRATLAKALNDMPVRNHVLIPLIHRAHISAHARSLGNVRMNSRDSELCNIADRYRTTGDAARQHPPPWRSRIRSAQRRLHRPATVG